jgi:hypothetical protein
MLSRIFLSSAALTIVMAASASAAPITTPPPPLTATGDVKAVYIFANAADTSFLDEASPVSWAGIFCNHPSGSCAGNATGHTVDLGTQSGPLVFGLRNVTTGKTYWTNAADSNGDYHAKFSANYSSFGLGTLPAGAAAALSGLPNVTFVAWEDLDASNGADFDYNDLIFAFSNTTAGTVPEPLTLSLFGAGLMGLAGLHLARRRRAGVAPS